MATARPCARARRPRHCRPVVIASAAISERGNRCARQVPSHSSASTCSRAGLGRSFTGRRRNSARGRRGRSRVLPRCVLEAASPCAERGRQIARAGRRKAAPQPRRRAPGRDAPGEAPDRPSRRLEGLTAASDPKLSVRAAGVRRDGGASPPRDFPARRGAGAPRRARARRRDVRASAPLPPHPAARGADLPFDLARDQFLDLGDRFLVGGGNDGQRDAGLAGAAGAADAVDVVFGMMRHVEIEDMADVGNVEAARGDVGATSSCSSPLRNASSAAMRAR